MHKTRAKRKGHIIRERDHAPHSILPVICDLAADRLPVDGGRERRAQELRKKRSGHEHMTGIAVDERSRSISSCSGFI